MRLKVDGWLRLGQQLKVNSRHIVASTDGVEIVINIPQRILSYTPTAGAVKAYPIAVARSTGRTPTGDFTIAAKEIDPPGMSRHKRRAVKGSLRLLTFRHLPKILWVDTDWDQAFPARVLNERARVGGSLNNLDLARVREGILKREESPATCHDIENRCSRRD